ncbi:Alkaline phosphatase synthesis transcriptional regulatory protein PhoP [Geodia barretti]|uniref:Probable transcriptional regulator ycf27 n=1 Tax=Geodia barretti TaxID=519541 RepID=A0AA35WVP6_GEOBA|nr:Alkaline phosphatase synthesis transcriptional regulatory protein PhoP [Geodia barretti]
MASKILIVEDEPDIVELLVYNLDQAGFKTEAVFNGADALDRVKVQAPDLVLLDLLLPEVDGLEVCRTLKRDPETASIPIIMLTAKGEAIDRIVGLELAADDYITKPFSPREVMLRIRAVLRHTLNAPRNKPLNQIQIDELKIDLDRHQVFSNGSVIDLTATEFKILSLFAHSPGRVFTRSILMDAVWGQEYYGIERTMDTHVSRLRRKLGQFGERIETVHGVGYRLKE